MRIISIEVKDLDKLLEKIKATGLDVEYGPHAVLLDHSEVAGVRVKAGDTDKAVIIAHYITPYYRAELSGKTSDDEYLEELLKIKHSGENWRIPVNPLIVIVFDDELVKLLEEYSDEYPVPDGARLVEEYRSRNPGYENIPRSLLARMIDSF